MGKIILLDELTSCQIAAGEVVERPASVVKETVENSIDAGATRITVEIKNGGIKYIKIDDNGSGMEEDDCVIAFDKHATSKLRCAEDLFNINTLGFRGEALASIAAVAKVTLRTKTQNAEDGTEVIFEGGELLSKEPCGTKKGTTIIVENLFFNTPARYKFLKKDVTEAGYVSDVMEKIALCHPDISFTLISDRKQVLYTPGTGDLKSCFFSIFGPIVANQMKEVSYTAGNITVSGLCGSRDLSFGTRGRQFTFVNGRFIRNKTITTAIDESYKTLVMKGKFPVVALMVSCPTTSVDVNVHPAKTEVRFSDEQAIFKGVYNAIYSALYEVSYAENNNLFDTYKSKDEVKPVQTISLFKDEKVFEAKEPEPTIKEEPKPIIKEEPKPLTKEEPKLEPEIELTVELEVKVEPESDIVKIEQKCEKTEEIREKCETRELTENELVYQDGRVIGQLFDTYILLEYEDKLYLLDQHAAHERLKYEEIKNALENFENNSQQLFLPETVKLSPSEYSKYSACRETFENLGFEIDDFGINTLIIRAVPTFLPIEKATDFVVSSIMEANPTANHTNVFSDHAVFTLACKAAIKANKPLSSSEISKLLKDLFEIKNPGTCPHGRPILIKMSKYEIERKFHRA